MIHRRTLLAGTVGLTLSGLLTGCRAKAANTLKITLLEGAVPAEVLKKFRKDVTGAVSFDLLPQLATVFQRLQAWQQIPQQDEGLSWRRLFPWRRADEVAKPDNLVSLGDYWLTSAIAQDLLEPLDIPAKSLEQLPAVWQQFVTRDRDGESVLGTENGAAETGAAETGAVNPASGVLTSLWAAPYRVQSLVIVYRQSKFPQATLDNPPFKIWRDLLQPQLSQKLALPEHHRLVLSILQKIHSGSFNLNSAILAVNPSRDSLRSQTELTEEEAEELAEELTQKLAEELSEPFVQLNGQVKTYDAQNSFKALINGDVDAAVGWSGAAITMLDRYRDLRMVVPTEGSLLSADMWVRPKGAEMSPAAQEWIDFCWRLGPATQISVVSNGLSPIFLTEGVSLPAALNDNFLPIEAMKNSELLLPISATQQLAYLRLWEQLRAG